MPKDSPKKPPNPNPHLILASLNLPGAWLLKEVGATPEKSQSRLKKENLENQHGNVI